MRLIYFLIHKLFHPKLETNPFESTIEDFNSKLLVLSSMLKLETLHSKLVTCKTKSSINTHPQQTVND